MVQHYYNSHPDVSHDQFPSNYRHPSNSRPMVLFVLFLWRVRLINLSKEWVKEETDLMAHPPVEISEITKTGGGWGCVFVDDWSFSLSTWFTLSVLHEVECNLTWQLVIRQIGHTWMRSAYEHVTSGNDIAAVLEEAKSVSFCLFDDFMSITDTGR